MQGYLITWRAKSKLSTFGDGGMIHIYSYIEYNGADGGFIDDRYDTFNYIAFGFTETREL